MSLRSIMAQEGFKTTGAGPGAGGLSDYVSKYLTNLFEHVVDEAKIGDWAGVSMTGSGGDPAKISLRLGVFDYTVEETGVVDPGLYLILIFRVVDLATLELTVWVESEGKSLNLKRKKLLANRPLLDTASAALDFAEEVFQGAF